MQTEVASDVVNKLDLLWSNVEMRDMTTDAWTDVWGGVANLIYQAGIADIEDVMRDNLMSSAKSDLSYNLWSLLHSQLIQAECKEIDWKVQDRVEEMRTTVDSATRVGDLLIQAIIDSVKSDLSNKWWLLHSQILQAEWKEIDLEVATKIEGMRAAVDPVTLAGDLVIQAIIDSVKSEL